MLKSIVALESAAAEWAKLRKARPTELDQLAGFEELSFESFEDVLSRWQLRLDQLAKSKWMEAPEAALTDIATERELNEVKGLIAQANGHGLNWLMSASGFLPKFVDVGQRISTIADRRTGIAKSLAKELAKSGVEQAGAIIEAGSAAKLIKSQAVSTSQAVEELEKAATQIKTQAGEADTETQKLAELRSEITEAHKFAEEKKTEVKALHDEVIAFRSKAETKSSELERKIDELSQSVTDAKTVTDEANSKLSKSLVNVRKQGLAGAFSSRGTKLLVERLVWIAVFAASLYALAQVARTVVTDIDTLTFEALLVALLRRLALAAPLVWLGWFSAKQLGRLGRIQEDYEYKAATALAFESYRREVEAFGDSSLTGELLKTTIGNFGANPVRLYDKAGEEPATPAEELISRVESDGTLRLLSLLQKFHIKP